MAHVLVAHADHDLRAAVVQALCEEANHGVVDTANAKLALTTLWVCPRRVVALIDERLSPFDALSILRVVGNDVVGGPLARHRYILMSTLPSNIRLKDRRLLSRIGAQVLALPFDIDTLLHMVDDAASGLMMEAGARPVKAMYDRTGVAALFADLSLPKCASV